MPFPADKALNDADKVKAGLYRYKKEPLMFKEKKDKMMTYSSLPHAHNPGSWSQPLRGGPDNLLSKGRMRPTRQAPPQRLGPQVRPGRWFANRFF